MALSLGPMLYRMWPELTVATSDTDKPDHNPLEVGRFV